MLVELGPVPSACALAWVAYARSVLASPQATHVPDDVQRAFAAFLVDIEAEANRCIDMRWSTSTSHEELSFLVHAFHRLVVEVNRTAGCSDRMPDPALRFYRMLVHGLLDALSSECVASAGFVEQLASFWPGVDPAESMPR